MSTMIMTFVDPEDSTRVREEIRKSGFAVNCDRNIIEVIVDTPFAFGLMTKSGDNVDEMLDKVITTMIQLKGITGTNWYIGSSHPELIKRHDLTKPTQKEVDMLRFTEWCGDNYFKMHGVWCLKYMDQRKKENHFTTEQLLAQYKSQQ